MNPMDVPIHQAQRTFLERNLKLYSIHNTLSAAQRSFIDCNSENMTLLSQSGKPTCFYLAIDGFTDHQLLIVDILFPAH